MISYPEYPTFPGMFAGRTRSSQPTSRGPRWLESATGPAQNKNRGGRDHINDALQQGGSIHVADEHVEDPARPTVLGKQPRGIPQRIVEKADKPGVGQLLDGLCSKPGGQQSHEHAGDGKKMPDGHGSKPQTEASRYSGSQCQPS